MRTTDAARPAEVPTETTASAVQQCRAVLIGVSRYEHPDLPPIPAAAANIADLAQLLSAPGAMFAAEFCECVAEPAHSSQVGDAVGRAAREAEDVLLVYFTGHGLLDRRGRLHLTLTGGDPDRIAWTTVPFETLREEILDSPARARILILDCCFSGRAFEAMSDLPSLVAAQTDLSGTYTIASSSANQTSHAPTGWRNTAFTTALLAAAATPGVTLEQVYRATDQELRRSGHPRPQRRSIDIAGDLKLFGPTSGLHPQHTDTIIAATTYRDDSTAEAATESTPLTGNADSVESAASSPDDPAAPRVFVSYTHDSADHVHLVLEFCTFLRREAGVDVRLDAWDDYERRDWRRWSTDQLASADFVLVIASPWLKRRWDGLAAPDEGRSAQFEAAIVRENFTRDPDTETRRVLPVVLPGRAVDEIPAFLDGYHTTYYVISEFTITGVNQLLNTLGGVAEHPMPPRGKYVGPTVVVPS